ncbi:hypothetical protein DEJ49_00960 [Streptomyces venezuelae]|uniref:CMP/dCMP-type deaminase domain-containing protein n=1 Tax=Streptomyces venezuelae TaxID=54571 RepID=A0A5P2CEF9_STRVZ|nr:hypothetical protein DEJ49_00960 [Streptomyces venezuelae]
MPGTRTFRSKPWRGAWYSCGSPQGDRHSMNVNEHSPTACGRPGPGDRTTVADGAWLAVACQLATASPHSESEFSAGAVVVADDGTELARSYSRESGAHHHAEEGALAKLRPDDPRLPAATLYASLEPCTEEGPRPRPCARLIRDAGVRRVVVAWRRPDTSGTGRIEGAGLTVIELSEYADAAKSPNSHLT